MATIRAERLLSTTQAAAALGLDRSRIKVLCAQGRIRGAVKIGNQWAIPAPPTILPPSDRPHPIAHKVP